MWKGFALSSSIPPPLGGFCINASSRMSVSMAAGQCCLFSLWLPFSLLLVLSLAPPLLHTLTQLKKWNFPVFWRTLSGWTLRELLNAPCQAISHRQDEGKREALEKKPSLQIEWKWKHCKVNGWKFHKCHSPFAKTVFRQHNNPLQHYSVCRTITVQFYLSIFHSTVRFFSSHPLSSPSSGVRLIQMMTWGNWGGGSLKIHKRTLKLQHSNAVPNRCSLTSLFLDKTLDYSLCSVRSLDYLPLYSSPTLKVLVLSKSLAWSQPLTLRFLLFKSLRCNSTSVNLIGPQLWVILLGVKGTAICSIWSIGERGSYSKNTQKVRKGTGTSQDLILSHGTAVLMGTKLSRCSGFEASLETWAAKSPKLPHAGDPPFIKLLLSMCLLLSPAPSAAPLSHSQFCCLLTSVIYLWFSWRGSWNYHPASFHLLPLPPAGNLFQCFEFQIPK